MKNKNQMVDYTYKATLDRVVDGDTIDVIIDLGFYINVKKRLRLLDIDTEELRSSDPVRREKAKQAKERVIELLTNSPQIYVETVMDKTGKYGRLLAYVWYEQPNGMYECLNRQLLSEGYSKAPKN